MRKTIAALTLFAATLSPVFAQDTTGKIHGHIQDPVGALIPNATVQVSVDGKAAKYTFTSDASGNYTGTGIAPGTYFLNLYQDTKPIDQLKDVKITTGTDQVEDFDLGRPESIALRCSGVILAMYSGRPRSKSSTWSVPRADNKSKNFAEADSIMTKDTVMKPDASVLWLELGIAQAGEKKWPDATTSYQKVISLETANPKPNQEIIAGANNGLGEAFASQSKPDDAAAAYDAAAKANPAGAGMYYSNEAIVLSRTGQGDATVAAADKAIAADPTKPIPYYLKGQALINKATVDPKTQKIQAPPGCAEAYQKYLELAPDGQFAADAKNILTEMGETVKTSYKAKK